MQQYRKSANYLKLFYFVLFGWWHMIACNLSANEKGGFMMNSKWFFALAFFVWFGPFSEQAGSPVFAMTSSPPEEQIRASAKPTSSQPSKPSPRQQSRPTPAAPDVKSPFTGSSSPSPEKSDQPEQTPGDQLLFACNKDWQDSYAFVTPSLNASLANCLGISQKVDYFEQCPVEKRVARLCSLPPKNVDALSPTPESPLDHMACGNNVGKVPFMGLNSDGTYYAVCCLYCQP